MQPTSPASGAPAPETETETAAPAGRTGAQPVGLLALLLLLASLAQASSFALRWDCFDYYQFWLVGQAAHQEDSANVWSPAERARLAQEGRVAARRAEPVPGPRPTTRQAVAASRREVLETYSTPWLYTLFGATASGDYERDLDRFQLASLFFFALGAAGLARLSGFGWTATALFVSLVTVWFAPTLSDQRVGNVNRAQVAALALYLGVATRQRLPARDVLAGAVLGAAAMFKPNLAFPVLTLGLGWMVLGRWRKLLAQAGGLALGALAAFGLSSAWFGSPGAWRDWSAVLGELMDEFDHAVSKGNFSLARLLDDHLGLGSPIALLLLLLALLTAALWLRRRRLPPGAPGEDLIAVEDLLLVGVGGALSLLTAKLAWLHYFLLALPLCAVLLRPGTRVGLRILALLAVLMLALEPLKDVLRFTDTDPPAAFLVCGGALLLYLLALADLATPPRPALA